MTPMCDLAKKYGTDKYPAYTPFYHALLNPRRGEIHNVLEIGIGTKEAMAHVPDYRPGASLRMWRDYFTNAAIYGVDVSYDACAEADVEGITNWCADSRKLDSVAIASVIGRFGLIVDDGSHEAEDQALTAQILTKILSPDGFYIIEDAHPDVKLEWPHSRIETSGGGKLILIHAG